VSNVAQSQRTLDVALFAHVVYRPEEELDLGQAALLIAEPEYPDLNIAEYLHDLDQLAVAAHARLEGLSEGSARASALVQHLLEGEGFRGNLTEYDDARNSFLNEVLDRRLGIPITLAVVMIEVARRLNIPLRGIYFPGHFLVGTEGRRPLLIDPFTGQSLTAPHLAELLERIYGQRRSPRPDEVQPATKHSILLRMLHNLRNIYMRQGDGARQRLAEERIRVLEAAVRALSIGGAQGTAARPSIIH
jgi:regulator of sirC expression with transglutaminase-like and TPR domain